MTRLEVIRYLVVLAPLAGLAGTVSRGPATRRERGALLLSFLAAFVGLGVLHELARMAGWWHYLDVAGAWRGFPVDLWLGWAVLWGPLPVALRRQLGLPLILLAALWVDVVAMPWLQPVVVLGDGWLWGEVAGLGVVLVPSVLLGRWCADRRWLAGRSALQLVVFGGLVLWLLPTTAFTLGDGSWHHLAQLSPIQLTLVGQLAAVLALPGLAAVVELAVQGNGTPYPWDPTGRLVTSGPYAYLANPMQVSVTSLLVLLAVLTRSWSLTAAVAGAVAFSAVVAEPHEREHLTDRFGEAFAEYRAAVRPWWPRWRPYRDVDATLYVAADCSLCRQLADAVSAACVPRLSIGSARAHPGRPERALYASTDGATATGVAAVARALEHLSLPAAMLGWFVRLPVVRPFIQVVTDIVVPPAPPAPEVSR